MADRDYGMSAIQVEVFVSLCISYMTSLAFDNLYIE